MISPYFREERIGVRIRKRRVGPRPAAWMLPAYVLVALAFLPFGLVQTVFAQDVEVQPAPVMREPTPPGAPLHDCMLVFRFGNDPGITPPAGSSEARDINDFGQIAGWAMQPDRSVQAIRWDADGIPTALGTLGGKNSCALGINVWGAVVGWAETVAGEAHAFVWQDGVMTDLGAGRTDLTVAYAINDDGTIAGMSWPMAAVPGSPMGRAVVWEDGQVVDLGACLAVPCSAGLDINNAGQVVGWSVGEELAQHAYVWDGIARTDLGAALPGASQARGINVSGAVVGWYDDEAKLRHAALWNDGAMTDIGTTGRRSVANAIADTGVIAGAEADEADILRPVQWTRTDRVVLGTLGGDFGEAYAVNIFGETVGWSQTADGVPRAFLWRDGAITALAAS